MSVLTAVSESASLLTQEIKVNPTVPPGGEKLTNLVGYLSWLVILAGVTALTYAGGKFGWERWHGGAVESPKIVAAALVGGIIATSAGAIMNAAVNGGS